jgi:hypothetical protein
MNDRLRGETKLGLIVAVIVAAAGLGLSLPNGALPAAKDAMNVRLDPAGPYLILASEKASKVYGQAIGVAKELHPSAAYATFPADDLAVALKLLREHRPRYALVFVEPRELDVNFAWQWLTLTTQINDDPFVDVRSGFITGSTPGDVLAFVQRIAAAVRGQAKLPGLLIDNLGPNPQAGHGEFYEMPGNFMIPAMDKRLALVSISHGTDSFTDDRLDSMNGAGLIHLGGHGHPERVDDGVRAAQVDRLGLSTCVVFSGACYTGVTHRWYDTATADGRVIDRTVTMQDSFCLNLLRHEAIGFLAALHPDHGMPVYQEMEFLAFSGASMGDVIKHTHDGVVLGAGGHLPKFERLTGGMPCPQWTPADVMLNGTAARVLFGDPALIVLEPCTDPPFRIAVKPVGDNLLHVTATLANPSLKSTYTDTYHDDLARVKNQFNDRALLSVDLRDGWKSIGGVEVKGVKAGGHSLQHRLVGCGVEEEGEVRRLHVQVDVESAGFMQSPFRVADAIVELDVKR